MRTLLHTGDEVRQHLTDKMLRRDVDEERWCLLVEDGYVEEIIEAECFADEDEALLRAIDRIRRLEGLPSSGGVRVTGSTSSVELSGGARFRSLAVAAVLAAQARGMEEVVTFRTQVLGGRLMEQDEVGPWVKRQPRPPDDARNAWRRRHNPPNTMSFRNLPLLGYPGEENRFP